MWYSESRTDMENPNLTHCRRLRIINPNLVYRILAYKLYSEWANNGRGFQRHDVITEHCNTEQAVREDATICPTPVTLTF